ncbi:hypothetical protein Tcan_15933 [Toxocara canis]|uniref:Uncharacterized protein n=2 Tax=Toxocara canis TaxID=6265 RepID=A0A0B2VEP4_TOXCA|nr:hypothetical protein Tcan_15933 [Toxocara canis]VDM38938.1 unnamed protein product [Toxocara canis]
MRVSVSAVVIFLLSVVFLSFLPGLYIYIYFTNIVFASFEQPFQFGALLYELIKRCLALILCPLVVIIYSDMAFPFVLLCFGQILQHGDFEVEEDETLTRRKKETLLRIQDRSRSISDEHSPKISPLEYQAKLPDKSSSDEHNPETSLLVRSKDNNIEADTMAEFFCGRDISLCTPVIQSP